MTARRMLRESMLAPYRSVPVVGHRSHQSDTSRVPDRSGGRGGVPASTARSPAAPPARAVRLAVRRAAVVTAVQRRLEGLGGLLLGVLGTVPGIHVVHGDSHLGRTENSTG